MVQRVSWFAPIDYHILEFFEAHDILVSPKVLAVNIDYDQQYCSKRCTMLAERGVLNRPEKGVYELSDLGRAFLADEIDAQEIEKLDSDE